jgi:hypothetical protein
MTGICQGILSAVTLPVQLLACTGRVCMLSGVVSSLPDDEKSRVWAEPWETDLSDGAPTRGLRARPLVVRLMQYKGFLDSSPPARPRKSKMSTLAGARHRHAATSWRTEGSQRLNGPLSGGHPAGDDASRTVMSAMARSPGSQGQIGPGRSGTTASQSHRLRCAIARWSHWSNHTKRSPILANSTRGTFNSAVNHRGVPCPRGPKWRFLAPTRPT